MAGNWRNFEQLEDDLTLEELTTLAKTIYDRTNEDRRFLAALQGVDLYENKQPDVDDDDDWDGKNDIAGLKGWTAEKDGFGIGMGLGYTEE